MNRHNVMKNWQEEILKMDIPQTGIFKTNKMKYTVTNEANTDVEVYDTLEAAHEYINAELVLINTYEKQSPYTAEDFYINRLKY